MEHLRGKQERQGSTGAPPQKPLERMSFIPPVSSGKGCGMPPASCQHRPQGPRRPSTLTGDVEPDGCLQGHLRSLEIHPTGEVGAMVLGPRGRGELQGMESLWVQQQGYHVRILQPRSRFLHQGGSAPNVGKEGGSPYKHPGRQQVMKIGWRRRGRWTP